MIPSDLSYNFPQAAFALFAVFVLLWLGWTLYRYRQDALQRFADDAVLDRVTTGRSLRMYWIKIAALSLAWLLGVLAWMGPQGNAHYPEEKLLKNGSHKTPGAEVKLRRRLHDVIFLVDASASMSVPDSRTGATRLDFGKDIVDQIISKLNGERVSLYPFTSQVEQLSPATLDYLFVRLMTRQIKINEGDSAGTDIAKALQEVKEKYFKNPSPGLKTVVLLSDGGDTALEDLQGEQREKKINEILALVDHAADLNLRVYTIGIGSLKGGEIPGLTYEGKSVHSSLEEDLLHRIANRGRGIYFRASNDTALSLAEKIVQDMGQDNPYLEDEVVIKPLTIGSGMVYDLYYQIPLGLALLLLLFVAFWPDAKTKPRQ